jgi:hypothetical protein
MAGFDRFSPKSLSVAERIQTMDQYIPHPQTTTPTPHQIAVLHGQSIAKRHRTPRQSARLAAKWVRGGVVVQPTVVMAARVFQVSAQLVAQEVAKVKTAKPTAGNPLVAAWDNATESERLVFVELVGAEQVWDALVKNLR